MDNISYYVKEILKKRKQLSDVPSEFREDVKASLESRKELYIIGNIINLDGIESD